MNRAAIVVGLVRLLGALPVLRWPLAGALLAILFDLGDLVLFNYLGLGWPPNYQRFDKTADLAYLFTFLVVAMRWSEPERRIAVGLFGLRIVGMLAFERTNVRALLVVCPNVFEFWFVFVAARDRFFPAFRIDARRAVASLAVLLALKLPQEYLLHVDRRLDHYALTEIVDSLLRWAGPR